MFAVMGRVQQTLNHFGKSVGRLVLCKSINLLRRRGKANKIVGCAPNQCPSVCRRRRLKPSFFQFRKDEGIDRGPTPLLILHGRRRRPNNRREGPVRALRSPIFRRLGKTNCCDDEINY